MDMLISDYQCNTCERPKKKRSKKEIKIKEKKEQNSKKEEKSVVIPMRGDARQERQRKELKERRNRLCKKRGNRKGKIENNSNERSGRVFQNTHHNFSFC